MCCSWLGDAGTAPVPSSSICTLISLLLAFEYLVRRVLQKPQMHCSDSFYCNWTNNPQIWSVDWWNREYVNGSFKKANRIDPFADIEYWTNWDYDAWNNRKFTVAQGDGLFKHVDRGNFGIF